MRASASLPPFVPPSEQSLSPSLSANTPLLVSLPSSEVARFTAWLEAPSLEISPQERIDLTASQVQPFTSLIDTSDRESYPAFASPRYTASDAPLQSLHVLADASVASNPGRFVLPQVEVPILDAAKVLTPAKLERLAADISALERDTGWRIRILTRFAPGTFDLDEVRQYWKVSPLPSHLGRLVAHPDHFMSHPLSTPNPVSPFPALCQ